jgi:hypothetical protein
MNIATAVEIREHLGVLAQLGSDSAYDLGRTWTIADTSLSGPRAPLASIRAGIPLAPSAARPKP